MKKKKKKKKTSKNVQQTTDKKAKGLKHTITQKVMFENLIDTRKY